MLNSEPGEEPATCRPPILVWSETLTSSPSPTHAKARVVMST